MLNLREDSHGGRKTTCAVVLLLSIPAALALALVRAPVGGAASQGGEPRRSQAPTRRPPGPSASPDQFVEVSRKAGIDFTLTSGGAEKRYIIEANLRVN